MTNHPAPIALAALLLIAICALVGLVVQAARGGRFGQILTGGLIGIALGAAIGKGLIALVILLGQGR